MRLSLPERLRKNADLIKEYRTSDGRFKEGTPKKIFGMEKEIHDFYREMFKYFRIWCVDESLTFEDFNAEVSKWHQLSVKYKEYYILYGLSEEEVKYLCDNLEEVRPYFEKNEDRELFYEIEAKIICYLSGSSCIEYDSEGNVWYTKERKNIESLYEKMIDWFFEKE